MFDSSNKIVGMQVLSMRQQMGRNIVGNGS